VRFWEPPHVIACDEVTMLGATASPRKQTIVDSLRHANEEALAVAERALNNIHRLVGHDVELAFVKTAPICRIQP